MTECVILPHPDQCVLVATCWCADIYTYIYIKIEKILWKKKIKKKIKMWRELMSIFLILKCPYANIKMGNKWMGDRGKKPLKIK